MEQEDKTEKEFNAVVDELLKEEREKNKKEIGDQLRALLKGHAELKSQVAAKEKELRQLEQSKMGEFTKSARQLFGKIEELDLREKQYYYALTEASSPDTGTRGL